MPEGISVETPSQTEIVVKGADKQLLVRLQLTSVDIVHQSLTKVKVFVILMKLFVVKKLRRSKRQVRWIRKHLVYVAPLVHVLKCVSWAAHRLVVHRTPRHIYAQLIAPTGSEVLAAASTVEADVRKRS